MQWWYNGQVTVYSHTRPSSQDGRWCERPDKKAHYGDKSLGQFFVVAKKIEMARAHIMLCNPLPCHIIE
jgi:hypothetical protein